MIWFLQKNIKFSKAHCHNADRIFKNKLKHTSMESSLLCQGLKFRGTVVDQIANNNRDGVIYNCRFLSVT